MKKKAKIIIGVMVIVILLTALLGLIGLFSNRPYTKVLEVNWGIDLPEAGAKEVYAFSEPSFHGDGIRYHVIDYPAGNETKKSRMRCSKSKRCLLKQLFPQRDR